MECGQCGGDVKVVETERRQSGLTWRRRECKECGYRFSTYEMPVESYSIMKKQAGMWMDLLREVDVHVTSFIREKREAQ